MASDTTEDDDAEEYSDALDALASASSSGQTAVTDLDARPAYGTGRRPRGSSRVMMDAGRRLTGNAWCTQCEASLVGKTLEETCEACGAPATDSVDTKQLGFADRSWLLGLFRGMNLMAVGTLVLIIFAGIGGGLIGYLQGDHRSYGISALTVHMLGKSHEALALIGGALLYGVSVWRITQPRPDQLDKTFPRGLAKATRWMFISLLAVQVVLGVVRAIVEGVADDNQDLINIFALGSIPVSLVHLAAWLVMMVYLMTLAKLIPKPRLARSTLHVAIALPATAIGGFAILMLIGFLTGISADPRSAMHGFVLSSCMYLLAILAMSIWYLTVLFHHRRVLAGLAGVEIAGKRKKPARRSDPFDTPDALY